MIVAFQIAHFIFLWFRVGDENEMTWNETDDEDDDDDDDDGEDDDDDDKRLISFIIERI